MTEITGISIPPGARAMLVSMDQTGKLVAAPVAFEKSILDIERDLLDHLNDQPYSSEWLTVLRDYCDARLKAREAARSTGAIITPRVRFDWDMTRLVKEVQHG